MNVMIGKDEGLGGGGELDLGLNSRAVRLPLHKKRCGGEKKKNSG